MRSQATISTFAGALRPHAEFKVSHRLKSGYSAVLVSIADPVRTTAIVAEKAVSTSLAATAGIDWTISKRATAATLYSVSANMADERPKQSLSARFTVRF